MIAWKVRFSSDGPARVFLASRSRSGEYSEPLELTNPGENAGGWGGDEVQMATNLRGDTAVVWTGRWVERNAGMPYADGLRIAVKPAGGALQPAEPVAMGQGEGSVNVPDVAIDHEGNVAVGWVGGFGRYPVAAFRSVDGKWTPGATVHDASETTPNALRIAFDANGTAVIVWNQYGGRDAGEETVHTALHPRGGEFEPAQRLSPPDTEGYGQSSVAFVRWATASRSGRRNQRGGRSTRASTPSTQPPTTWRHRGSRG